MYMHNIFYFILLICIIYIHDILYAIKSDKFYEILLKSLIKEEVFSAFSFLGEESCSYKIAKYASRLFQEIFLQTVKKHCTEDITAIELPIKFSYSTDYQL